ncbi:phBC6A51 family helix-turn-helix protein [Evansella tamaricis]|uniref:Homeodomain phBC6A51-type domain-containing protein n=1 Tax=Evansella tamaricis TaxID=2069301 RepID=A0ABS6JLH8_9BACI|nr:phBC6A51 family helix-turn-helix protein [Evansella tamaricis]MBU9714431.1 hypothetical protein [Evansella tamaricis]
MSDKLNNKQIEVIDMIVNTDKSITEICELSTVPRSTYYKWKKENKVFNEALEEALNHKEKILKQNIKSNAIRYIKWLEDIGKDNENANARVNSIKELLSLGGLKEAEKLEIKNDDSDTKNVLLEKIKKKKQLESE